MPFRKGLPYLYNITELRKIEFSRSDRVFFVVTPDHIALNVSSRKWQTKRETMCGIRLRGVTLETWNDHVIVGGLMDLWTGYLGVVRKLLQYRTFLNLRLLLW